MSLREVFQHCTPPPREALYKELIVKMEEGQYTKAEVQLALDAVNALDSLHRALKEIFEKLEYAEKVRELGAKRWGAKFLEQCPDIHVVETEGI